MNYTIEKNKEYGELIKEKFGLERYPVAIKFVKTESEVPDNIPKIQVKIRHCEMITKAGIGDIFYSTSEDQICKGGAGAIHINKEPIPEKILNGKFYYNLGRFESKEIGKKVADKLPKLKEFNEAIIYSPLEKADFEVDVLILIGTPIQGMKISQCIVHKNQDRVEADFSGIQSICADAVARPILTKTPNVTLGCDGSRNYAKIKEDELIIGFVKENIEPFVDSIKSIYC